MGLKTRIYSLTLMALLFVFHWCGCWPRQGAALYKPAHMMNSSETDKTDGRLWTGSTSFRSFSQRAERRRRPGETKGNRGIIWGVIHLSSTRGTASFKVRWESDQSRLGYAVRINSANEFVLTEFVLTVALTFSVQIYCDCVQSTHTHFLKEESGLL